MNILYITVHLGGGVGKAILGVVKETKDDFKSTIIMLEQPEKEGVVQASIQDGIDIRICPSVEELRKILINTDIVVLNWWNHPLMASFLYEFPQITCRMIIWSHINGCTYPYLPFDFLEVFDQIWFTSRYSYENKLWTEEENKYIRQHSDVIYGNGEFKPEKMPYKKNYEIENNFRIGYVGTLNYSKIHKNYIGYCERVLKKFSNIEIVLVGEIDKELSADICRSEYSDRFICRGYCEDVEREFLSFDVLGYILNEGNYGTTENVILEAMAYGIPVIVYNGGVERQIIDDGVNGYLVNNEDEYLKCIEKLYYDKKLRERIGLNAREKVCREFASRNNIVNIKKSFINVINREKHIFQFKKVIGETPYKWFLKFTGEDRKIFQEIIAHSESNILNDEILDRFIGVIMEKIIYIGERKSSILHYYYYYKDDLYIRNLVDKIKKYL